jgi:hypothetical protein
MATRGIKLGLACGLALLLQAWGAAAQTSDDLFNDQVLHRIDLFINTKDWYRLRAEYTTNNYYPANFKWNGQTVTNVAVRSRGSGSRSSTKPAIRVDFNRYDTGRTFLGLTALDLNNLAQDPSNVREVMAMKFYRAMGIPAPRGSMAAVYVNNEYQGLHFMVEEIDEATLTRMVGENTGHLFEYKWTFHWVFEYLGADLAAYAPLYELKTQETDSASVLYGPIEAFLRTVNDASDQDFIAAVSEYLDPAAFVRLAAVQAFLAECDGLLGGWGVNNHNLYRFDGRNLHQFIVWDASSSFFLIDYPLDFGHAENVLMRRIMAVPELHALYASTLLDAVALADQTDEPSTPGYFEREITRFQDQIRAAAYADTLKPYTNDEFDAASAFVLEFAQRRSTAVRSLMWQVAATTGEVERYLPRAQREYTSTTRGRGRGTASLDEFGVDADSRPRLRTIEDVSVQAGAPLNGGVTAGGPPGAIQGVTGTDLVSVAGAIAMDRLKDGPSEMPPESPSANPQPAPARADAGRPAPVETVPPPPLPPPSPARPDAARPSPVETAPPPPLPQPSPARPDAGRPVPVETAPPPPSPQPSPARPDAGRPVPVETAPPPPSPQPPAHEPVRESLVSRQGAPAIATILISGGAADSGDVLFDKPSLDRTAPKIIVTVQMAGARRGTLVSVSVTHLGSNVSLGPLNNEITVDGDVLTVFSFANAVKEWPVGAYHVTARLSDGTPRTKGFRIE